MADWGWDGRRLRQLRHEAGLSLRQLAKKMGPTIHQGTISKWEGCRTPDDRGVAPIDSYKVEDMAHFLGCTPLDFYDEEDG